MGTMGLMGWNGMGLGLGFFVGVEGGFENAGSGVVGDEKSGIGEVGTSVGKSESRA